MKRKCIESRMKGVSYIEQNEGMLTGLVAYHEGSAFYNTLLKEIYKGMVEVT